MIKTLVGYTIRKYKKNGEDRRLGVMYCLSEKEGVNGHACEEVTCFGDLIDKCATLKLNANYDFIYDIQGSRAFLNDVVSVK